MPFDAAKSACYLNQYNLFSSNETLDRHDASSYHLNAKLKPIVFDREAWKKPPGCWSCFPCVNSDPFPNMTLIYDLTALKNRSDVRDAEIREEAQQRPLAVVPFVERGIAQPPVEFAMPTQFMIEAALKFFWKKLKKILKGDNRVDDTKIGSFDESVSKFFNEKAALEQTQVEGQGGSSSQGRRMSSAHGQGMSSAQGQRRSPIQNPRWANAQGEAKVLDYVKDVIELFDELQQSMEEFMTVALSSFNLNNQTLGITSSDLDTSNLNETNLFSFNLIDFIFFATDDVKYEINYRRAPTASSGFRFSSYNDTTPLLPQGHANKEVVVKYVRLILQAISDSKAAFLRRGRVRMQ